MTFYTLIQYVDYEGSTFHGNFASLEDVFTYLHQAEGWMMDEWFPQQEELELIDNEYDIDFVSVSTGWRLDAPGDSHFHIYACSVRVA